MCIHKPDPEHALDRYWSFNDVSITPPQKSTSVAYITFVCVNCASLAKIAPSRIEIRTVWFENVLYSWPSARKFVYSGSSIT